MPRRKYTESGELIPGKRDMKAAKPGRYTKAGEAWITIRIPEEVKRWLMEAAAQNDRSESYVARCLLLSKMNEILNMPTESHMDRMIFPALFNGEVK